MFIFLPFSDKFVDPCRTATEMNAVMDGQQNGNAKVQPEFPEKNYRIP